MADTLQVVITGKDGVSKVFKEVARSADATGKAVSKAGSEGEKGFRRLGDSAKGARIDMSDLGAAATVLGAGLAYASNAALSQQQTIIGLRAAYGSAADEMLRFADEMASVTIFNDDDILRGERYFASLKNNYDLSIEQIQELMRVTADLASASGTTFEDASSRVTAAIRGEGEAAEYLGLTMNQQAIDRENLTLSMSNQEAAQFRLNALYEQTGAYAGAAQALAESEVGTRAKLTNAIQDNAQALGNLIGPMGTMVAGAGFAVTGLSSMAGVLGKVGGSLRTAATSARATSLGMGALAVATNPVALGLAAIAAGGAFAWSQFQQGKEDAKSLEDALRSLNEVQNQLLLSGEDQRAQAVSKMSDYIEEAKSLSQTRFDWSLGLTSAERQKHADAAGLSQGMWLKMMREEYTLTSEEVKRFSEAQTALGQAFLDPNVNAEALSEHIGTLFDQFMAGNLTLDGFLAGMQEASTNTAQFRLGADDAAASADTLSAALDGLSDAQRALDWKLDDLRMDGLGAVADDIGRLNSLVETTGAASKLAENEVKLLESSLDRIGAAMQDGSVDADKINDQIADLALAYSRGDISAQQFLTGILKIAGGLDDYANQAGKAKVATELAGRAFETAASQIDHTARNLEIYTRKAQEAAAADALMAEHQEMNSRAMEADRAAMDEILAKRAELISQMTQLAGIDDPLSQMALIETARDLDAVTAGVTGVRGALEVAAGIISGGLEDASQSAVQLANNLMDASTALDTVQRVVVGNTNAIGQQLEGLKSWSDTLIGDPGVWAEIDDLLGREFISIGKYNEAQEAQVQITKANWEAQRDLLAIQAAQAPVLGDLAERQANYVRGLREMNDGFGDAATGAQDQLAALGWMDTGMQERVQQFIEVGNQLDELGPKGRASFQAMVDGITATDPVMTAMLENLGLIRQETDGSYTINFEGLDKAGSDMDQLRQSIDALTLALGGTPPTFDLEVNGQEDVEALTRALADAPTAKTVDVRVQARNTIADALREAMGGGPGAGDGTGGPALTVPLDVEPAPGIATKIQNAISGAVGAGAGDGTGGPAVTVDVGADTAPAQLTIADLQNIPPIEAPVGADTTSAAEQLAGLGQDIPPVQVPVELKMAAMGDHKDDFASRMGSQNVTVEINAVDNASPVIGNVVTFAASVDGYSATVAVEATDNASLAIGNAVTLAASVDGYTSNMAINALDLASPVIGTAVSLLASVDGYTSTMAVNALDLASPVVGGAVSFLASVDGYASTMAVNAVDNASPVIGDAVAFLASVDGYESTMTLNVVTNEITNVARRTVARHGGIPGYAHGGIPVELAEAGPELLHFATGGVMPVYDRGVYSVPPNTYVSPNNANPVLSAPAGGGWSGPPVQLHVHGNVYGVDDLVESMSEAIYRQKAGHGGLRA